PERSRTSALSTSRRSKRSWKRRWATIAHTASRVASLTLRTSASSRSLLKSRNRRTGSGGIMRLLITGGTGCLGAAITERALERGASVLCLDNFATSRRDSLAPHPSLEIQEADVSDALVVANAFDQFRPTHVVHSAASYKDPNNWAGDIATNATGTAHV